MSTPIVIDLARRVSFCRWAAFAAAMAAAGPLGCGDDAEPLEAGEVSLQWLVGPHGCEEARTTTIEVRDVDGDGGWTFGCASRGGRLPGIAPGTYNFELRALDELGDVTFIGFAERVQVRPGGVTTVPPVPLEAAPADLQVEWNFGGPLCGQVDVSSVAVRVFDANAIIVNEATVPCEDGAATLVVPPGQYDVVVLGLDGEGELRFETVFTRILERGDQAWQQVLLGGQASE